MNVLEIKGRLFDLLWGVEDADTLLKIKDFVSETIWSAKEERLDWWNELDDEMKVRLERLLREAEKGENLMSHEEAMSLIDANFKEIRHAS